MDNPDKATVSQLKLYLKDLGVTTTGYRRSELINLVKSSAETGLEQLEKLTESSFSTVNLRTVGDIVYFDPEQGGQWSDNLKKMPPVELSHCLTYAEAKCQWGVKRLINFQKDDGFRLFQTGFINDVKIANAGNNHVFVKSTCTRETSLNEAPYKVWVLLNTDGNIVSGHCYCPAGTSGTCKHVTALLFSLNAFHERHLDRSLETCTDKACQWDKPRKVSKPQLWDDIDLRLDDSTPHPKKPKIDTYKPYSQHMRRDKENEKKLLSVIKESSIDENDCMAYHILGSDSESDSDDNNDHVPILSVPDLVRGINHGDFVETLKDYYTKDKCDEIEVLTRGQSDNEYWRKYRTGRITSSIVHAISHATNTTMAKKDNYLLKKIHSQEHFTSAATDFGIQHEDEARTLYQSSMKEKHKEFQCKQSGFVINPSLPILGGSPDGVTSCKCCGRGLLEIKCSYKYRNEFMEKTLSKQSGYKCYFDEGKLILKKNTDWYSQIQMMMAVADLPHCDFVLFSLKGFHMTRINRDPEVWDMLYGKVVKFYETHVIHSFV